MVVIIVGILAAVALPQMGLLFGYDENGYKEKVKATLEHARRSAIAHRRVACVSVANSAVSLKVELNSPEATGSGVCGAGGGLAAQDLALPSPDSKCTGGVLNKICPPSEVSLPDASINFDGLGRPLNGNTGAVLTANTVWTVTNENTGDAVSLNIAAESGYVY